MAGENPQTGIDIGQKAPEDQNSIRDEIQRNLGSLLKSLEQGKAAGVAGFGELFESLNILREENPQVSPLFPTKEMEIPAVSGTNIDTMVGQQIQTSDHVSTEAELSTEAKAATTTNGAPLSSIEQAVIAYADERDKILNETILERIGERIERVEAMLPEGVKYDPMNDNHFELSKRVIADPEEKKLEESSERFRNIKYAVIARADIQHQLANLALEQQKLELGGEKNNEMEKKIQKLESSLSDRERDLVEDIGIAGTEGIPELAQFALEIRIATTVKPEIPTLGQAKTVIEEFNFLLGEVLDEDQTRVHGHKLLEVKDLSERYSGAKRTIEEVGKQFSHPFSSNPARRTVLTRRIEMAIAETRTIEADYRARNTVNGILFLEELGYGAIGVVRRARVKGGIAGLRGEGIKQEEVDVAIKIPKEREFKGAQKMTEEEGKLLERLVQKQNELFPGTLSHFPDSVMQTLPDGTCVLAIEFIPKENNLYKLTGSQSSQIGGRDSKITQEQIHDAMIKHYEALAVAHAAGVTVNDKKGSDFYYFPENGRYVMLDWNVTSNIQEEKYKEKIDLWNGIRFFLEIGTGIAYDAIDSHPEALKSGPLKKMRLLIDRLWGKTDTTTAMDMIGILKNIDRLSEEEIARPKSN